MLIKSCFFTFTDQKYAENWSVISYGALPFQSYEAAITHAAIFLNWNIYKRCCRYNCTAQEVIKIKLKKSVYVHLRT